MLTRRELHAASSPCAHGGAVKTVVIDAPDPRRAATPVWSGHRA